MRLYLYETDFSFRAESKDVDGVKAILELAEEKYVKAYKIQNIADDICQIDVEMHLNTDDDDIQLVKSAIRAVIRNVAFVNK